VSVSGQRICRLAEEAAEASDPEAALEALTLLREELGEFERQQVARALTAGRSFGGIARALGISRQAVHRRFRDLAPRRARTSSALPPSPEVRLVFEYARAEAVELRASVVAAEHVLIGILRTGDQQAAAALAREGVTLESLRLAARKIATGVPPSKPGRGTRAVDIRALLADSIRWATRSGAQRIEVEHVLRAALARVSETGSPAGVPHERVVALLDAPPADCLEA